jgi:hypothetical protein
MHINLIHTTIDPARLPEAIAGLDGVRQRLAALPGFKGAYWLQPVEGHGMALNLWEDEASAQGAIRALGTSPAPGVTVERTETRAIIAQA